MYKYFLTFWKYLLFIKIIRTSFLITSFGIIITFQGTNYENNNY